MFARHVSMHLKPNTRAELTQTIENEVLPILRRLSRFAGAADPRSFTKEARRVEA